MILPLALATVMVVVYVILGGVESEDRTCSYYGSPPKPVPGEHWMKTARRELHKRCDAKGVPVCPKETPLGMEDGRIPNSSITASSFHRNKPDHGPLKARLNNKIFAGAWVADQSDSYPWIQVDFLAEVYLTGLITQGRSGFPQWVDEYQVMYTDECQSWHHVTDADGTPIKFTGNTDSNTKVTVSFPSALHTRIIRILPTEYRVCSMRFEVLGCYQSSRLGA